MKWAISGNFVDNLWYQQVRKHLYYQSLGMMDSVNTEIPVCIIINGPKLILNFEYT